jgi:hypothetical protein
MKSLVRVTPLFVLFTLMAAALHAKYVPTPEMAMSFGVDKDPKKWVPQFMDGNAAGIIFELVPAGQSINAWQEMVAQQIAFTKKPLRGYVDEWKAMLFKADPNIELKEEQREDGSILATYTSLAAQEMSLRRFIKAKDGVYMLAYHVRPALKQEDRVRLWREILIASTLVPNPEKKK